MTRAITWTEIKLLTREPMTLLMSFLFPAVLMVLLAGSFGNEPSVEFGGIGGVDFYVPIYASAAIAVMGFLGLPTHLAAYRESGVFRRYRAGGIPAGVILAALAAVTGLVAILSTVVMIGLGVGLYDLNLPDSPLGVALAVLVGSAAFVALGSLLGAVLPSARAAQGAGLALFFGLFFVAGGGPPPYLLPEAINTVVDYTPMGPLVDAFSSTWHGQGIDVGALVALAGFALVASLLAVRRLRRP